MKQSIPVVRNNLNQLHMSDYYFGGGDCRTRQFSRKQAGELLGNIDEAESQIRDYYDNADENNQIVEGIISSIALTRREKSRQESISIRSGFRGGSCLYTYKVEDSGFIHDGEVWEGISYAMLIAWIHRLERAGVYTYFTMNDTETAKLLVAIYQNEQKSPEEHSTLQRYIRPRLQLKHHEPFVESLMYLSAAYKLGIGEVTATKIAGKYSNLLDIAMAEVGELCTIPGIGVTTAEKLLKAIGRQV